MTSSPAILVTRPKASPVSISEAKFHWRIDGDDQDVVIQNLIEAATLKVQQLEGRVLITQTWQQDFSTFDDVMRLDWGNVIGITSVGYYDASNALQTLSSSVYGHLADLTGPYLSLKAGQSWPGIYSRTDAIRVTWTAGFGPAAGDVPANLRQAVNVLGGYWYDNRSDGTEEIPAAVRSLVSTSRRMVI